MSKRGGAKEKRERKKTQERKLRTKKTLKLTASGESLQNSSRGSALVCWAFLWDSAAEISSTCERESESFCCCWWWWRSEGGRARVREVSFSLSRAFAFVSLSALFCFTSQFQAVPGLFGLDRHRRGRGNARGSLEGAVERQPKRPTTPRRRFHSTKQTNARGSAVVVDRAKAKEKGLLSREKNSASQKQIASAFFEALQILFFFFVPR